MESITGTASIVGTIQKNLERKQMSYKFENTVGGQLFEELKRVTADCIEYNGKSLTEWEAGQRAEMAIAEAKHAKMIREKKRQENIESYRKQAAELSRYDAIGQFVDLASEFDRSEVHIDQDGQYRAQMAFASAAEIDMEDWNDTDAVYSVDLYSIDRMCCNH